MEEKVTIKDFALTMAQAGFDKKGSDIAIMDLESISSIADYFVIISATNSKQAQSIADEIEDKGAELSRPVLHREGYHEGEWILLDFGDIICHIFGGNETRAFYGLEPLWNDAARVEFVGK